MGWDKYGGLIFLLLVFGVPTLLAVMWAAEQEPQPDRVRMALQTLVEEIGRMMQGGGDGV